MYKHFSPVAAVAVFLGGCGAGPTPAPGPAGTDRPPQAAALQQAYPETHELLIRLERARGLVFGGLAAEGRAVRAGGGAPSPGFESDLLERLSELVAEGGTAERVAADAAAGYAVLGERGAEVIQRAHAFQRETIAILADPAIADPHAALAAAVVRYRSRPDVALPSAPKDMDVLYDHPQAFAFRDRYPDLDGFVWAGLWLKLAATEPLTDFDGRAERAAGLDTVATRYYAKLSHGEPPRSFPSQIPLAPAIAPGFIFLSPESAMIWDNLSLMQEVLADILASPDVPDVRGALDTAIDFFLAPDLRVTERGEWEIMALQHGIFFQGGYPLAVMTRSELNGDGHAAHLRDGTAPRPMPIITN